MICKPIRLSTDLMLVKMPLGYMKIAETCRVCKKIGTISGYCDDHGAKEKIIRKYLRRIKDNHIHSELTFDDLNELFKIEKCPFCAVKLHMSVGLGCVRASSLDRINNKGTYTKNNVHVCCQLCNSMRGNASIDSYLRFIHEMKDSTKTHFDRGPAKCAITGIEICNCNSCPMSVYHYKGRPIMRCIKNALRFIADENVLKREIFLKFQNDHRIQQVDVHQEA